MITQGRAVAGSPVGSGNQFANFAGLSNLISLRGNFGANVFDKDKLVAYGASATSLENLGVEVQDYKKRRRAEDRDVGQRSNMELDKQCQMETVTVTGGHDLKTWYRQARTARPARNHDSYELELSRFGPTSGGSGVM